MPEIEGIPFEEVPLTTLWADADQLIIRSAALGKERRLNLSKLGLHTRNADAGTTAKTFEIAYQSTDNSVAGLTVLVFGGGLNSPRAAIGFHWDQNEDSFTLKKAIPYTGTIADVWEDIGSGGGGSSITEADTNSINLTIASDVLTADLNYQDSPSVNLSVDASGLKAEAIFGTTTGTVADGGVVASNSARLAPETVTALSAGLTSHDTAQALTGRFSVAISAAQTFAATNPPAGGKVQEIEYELTNATASDYIVTLPPTEKVFPDDLHTLTVPAAIGGVSGVIKLLMEWNGSRRYWYHV